MIVRDWRKGDVESIKVQDSQLDILSHMDDLNIEPLAEMGVVWTIEQDNDIICVCGLAPQWTNRAVAWAVLSETAGKYFIKLHRIIKKLFNQVDYRRIEATVDINFKQGHRWMRMLGFEPEGYMKAYTPLGDDQILYARVRT